MIASDFLSKSGSPARFLVPLAAAALGFWTQSASALVTYSIDDGTAEDSGGFGPSGPGDGIFLNEFSIQPGASTITSISIAFGDPSEDATNSVLNGLAYTAVLYSDPNGDGNPTDGQLLATGSGTISNVDTNTFLTTSITPTTVTGTDFFVGFEILNEPANTYSAGLDTTLPTYPHQSWVTYAYTPGTFSDTDLAGNQFPPEAVETVPGAPAGNWLIRANAVPEPSTWAYVLASIAGGCLLFRRRRMA